MSLTSSTEIESPEKFYKLVKGMGGEHFVLGERVRVWSYSSFNEDHIVNGRVSCHMENRQGTVIGGRVIGFVLFIRDSSLVEYRVRCDDGLEVDTFAKGLSRVA